jgi:nicotinamidase-related amidase
MAPANEHPANRRPNTALLVIDVQTDVVALAYDRDDVISNISQVVAAARAAGALVVWVQHDDADLPANTDGWEIVAELDPRPDEVVVFKNFRDSFQATTLEQELADRDVGTLVITGAQTDFCVRWTLHGALARGYDTVLVGDAHTTDEVSPGALPSGEALIAHTNSVWGSQAYPSVSTQVMNAAEVTF